MNSELLYITRKLGYPSSFGTRAGLGDFLEQYPDGVYAENGGGAPIGWESAAVWFGGDSERAAARFERMMSERNELSRVFRTRIAGVLLLTFIYRLKSRMVTAIPIIGGQPQPIDPTWLYFTMPEGGTISLNKTGNPTVVDLEYSIDRGQTWTVWQEDANGNRSLVLNAGQRMYVRNTSETQTGFSTSENDYYHFVFTITAEAHGNTNSLLCKNADSVTTLSASCYRSMFSGCTSLVSAPELPATTLATSCYRSMFSGCTSLVSVPELPATTLATGCYQYMFYNCTSLTIAPELQATTLATECYRYMFSGCTSLVSAPELPATTLATECYRSMFYNCTSLVSAPELPATTLATSCYYSMFNGCTSLVSVPELPATTLATGCYQYMFYNCTSLTIAPELQATTLATSCCYGMFYNCTSLVSAPELPATTLATSCYRSMFNGCTSLVSAPELPATTLATSCYQYMFYNCTSLTEIRTMMTNISASNCLTNWLYGIDTSGDFYCPASLTIPSGASGIPSGWTRNNI